MASMLSDLSALVANPRNDDDFVDRLNHRFTKALLVIFAIVLSAFDILQVERIVCWVPVNFSDYQEEYAEQYCWVRNTYYLPFTEYIPHEAEDEKRQMVTYYQWVPAILLLQALFFHMPCSIWRTYNKRCGLDVADFVEKSQALPFLDQLDINEFHEKTLGHLAVLMSRFAGGQNSEKKKQWTLSLKNAVSATCLRPLGGGHGRFLVSLYFFCKLLFLVNVVGQLFLLDKLLGMDYHSYGFKVLEDYANGNEDWTMSRAFPRVTMCDFKVRRLGNIQRYTVQCALPVNLYNEKVFLFLYFWLVMVAIFTFLNFIRWVALVVPSSRRRDYVKRHIIQALEAERRREETGEPIDINLNQHDRNLRQFADKYLKLDGVFVLRLTGRNVDTVSEEDLVLEIWREFLKSQPEPEPQEREPESESDSIEKPELYPNLI